MKPSLIPLALLLLLGCHRTVDLKINGHASEYLEASIQNAPDGFKVLTSMPKGNWAVRLVGDSYTVSSRSESPLPQCWWIVPKDRLRNSRPFRLELCDPITHEPKLIMELKPKLPGEGFLEGTLKAAYCIARPGIRY